MSNPRAEVVVIGRARSGKSFLGNQLRSDKDSDDSDEEVEVEVEVEEDFTTSAGDESCTMDIKSKLFLDCAIKGLKEKYDITYTDTPGFPDTRGAKESIEVYNTIVNYINENKPTAIIWLLTPTREQHDRELYQTYALLMQEFANKGIYCAVLANNPGPYKMKKKERNETEEKVKKILENYGLEAFSDDDPYVSVSSKYLRAKFMEIVVKGIEVSEAREDVSAFRTFDELEAKFTSGFKANEATEAFVKGKRHAIKKKQSDIGWHKKRISDLKKAMLGTTIGSVFTFGLSNIATAGMAIAVTDSENKVSRYENNIRSLQAEIDQVDIYKVVESHKKSMKELAKIYEAMDDKEKAEKLRNDAEKLSAN